MKAKKPRRIKPRDPSSRTLRVMRHKVVPSKKAYRRVRMVPQ